VPRLREREGESIPPRHKVGAGLRFGLITARIWRMEHLFTKRNSVIVVAALALAAVGFHAYYNSAIRQEPAPQQNAENTDSSPGHVGIEIGGDGKYTIELVPVTGGDVRIPALRRPIVFSAAFSEEARVLMQKKIDASIAALEKDPRIFDEWMNLAILRKTVDDYEGARQVWEFLTVTNPEQASPYANLASLYAFDLKDPARAEQNFTAALKIWTKDVSVWRNAYEFYRYVRKDDAKAKETLQSGIRETDSPDLKYLLERYSELQ